MADEADNTPWWKRIWPMLVALVVGVLGAIAFVTGRSALAGKKMAEAQKQDNDVLKSRLNDVNVLQDSKLDAVKAREDLAEQKAENAHEAREHAIDDKAKQDAQALHDNPDAVAGALLDSLKGAQSKLQ